MSVLKKHLIVQWPECQFFMNDKIKIHLADDDKAYEKFGDSAYFVEVEYYETIIGHPPLEGETIYLAIPFPESQFFMGFENGIYLINDEEGAKQYGNAAYFVEEKLFHQVKTKPSLPFFEP